MSSTTTAPVVFKVSANHVSPNWRFEDHVVTAKPSPGLPGKWYATADRLGCSRDYATAEDAVRSLFYANACTSVRVAPVQPEPEPAAPAPEVVAEAQAACDAWSKELHAAFGKRAGDKRYTDEGKGAAGSTLRAAYDRFAAATAARWQS